MRTKEWCSISGRDRFLSRPVHSIGTGVTDLGEFGVERLRAPGVTDCLGGARGTQKTVKAVRRILQHRPVFSEGFGGTPDFHEHVREHFARGNADGFAAIFVLTVGGGAQLLESVLGLSLGE